MISNEPLYIAVWFTVVLVTWVVIWVKYGEH